MREPASAMRRSRVVDQRLLDEEGFRVACHLVGQVDRKGQNIGKRVACDGHLLGVDQPLTEGSPQHGRTAQHLRRLVRAGVVHQRPTRVVEQGSTGLYQPFGGAGMHP